MGQWTDERHVSVECGLGRGSFHCPAEERIVNANQELANGRF